MLPHEYLRDLTETEELQLPPGQRQERSRWGMMACPCVKKRSEGKLTLNMVGACGRAGLTTNKVYGRHVFLYHMVL